MPRNLPALLTLLLLLSSCAVSSQTLAPAPPRPTLESAVINDQGGIYMDAQDTAELLHYLDALERR